MRKYTGLALQIFGSPMPAAAERSYESMKKAKANYMPRLKNGVTFYEG
jgi:hypothetical protein